MAFRFLLALVAAVAMNRAACAHPHLWIETGLAPVFQNGEVVAFEVTWTFDAFYSELVRQDFDLDHDGTLSASELETLAEISAANLVELGFFTHLRIGADRPRVTTVETFTVQEIGARVRYGFRVPLPEPVDPAQTAVAIAVFDETYYIDFQLTENVVAALPANNCEVELVQDLEQPIYYGAFYPTYAAIDCASRS